WPRLLISPALSTRRLPRPSRTLRRAGTTDACGDGLRRPIPKRNLRPALVHAHRPGLIQQIETIAAPAPLLGRLHQSSLHRITMHISQFLHLLLGGRYVEVVEAGLPKCSARGLVSEQIALAGVAPFALG